MTTDRPILTSFNLEIPPGQVAALLGVMTFGILQGVVIGVALSLIWLIAVLKRSPAMSSVTCLMVRWSARRSSSVERNP